MNIRDFEFRTIPWKAIREMRISTLDQDTFRDDVVREEVFKFDEGLAFVKHLTRQGNLHRDVIYLAARPAGQAQCEVAMQYNDGYARTCSSLRINPISRGTHLSGFRTASRGR